MEYGTSDEKEFPEKRNPDAGVVARSQRHRAALLMKERPCE